jgi:hypothetical protein
MYARAVEQAEAHLVDLRRDELQEAALSGVVLLASLAAATLYPPLAVPMLAGGVALGIRGMYAFWRRWDLVDRLADQPEAYVIPDVRAYAMRDTRMERRRAYARLIRYWLAEPGPSGNARISAAADELEQLARELDDCELSLDPACAVACRRLLGDYTVSPLFNDALPCEDVRSWICRIRAGFGPRGGS